jgi:hypothetical protein
MPVRVGSSEGLGVIDKAKTDVHWQHHGSDPTKLGAMSAEGPEVFEVDIHVRDVCAFGARLATRCRLVLAGQADVGARDFSWWLKVLGDSQVRAQIEQLVPGYCESYERLAHALARCERGSVDLLSRERSRALETLQDCVQKLLEIQAEMRRRQRKQALSKPPFSSSWPRQTGDEDEARMRTVRWEQKRTS